MAEIIELPAKARTRVGKGAARQARREGNVPAVIYGAGEAATAITVDGNELWKQVLKGSFTSSVFRVTVDDKKILVIPRDVQVHPVRDTPEHVDFLRIGKDGIIQVAVPVRFINQASCPGLKRGGMLNIVRHEVEVFCPYDQIPAAFEIDLDGMQIGRSIHISFVTLPDNVKPVISNRDFTIATITGKGKKEEEEKPAAAAAAPAEEEAKK